MRNGRISVCILETGYPLFIWLRRTRLIWLLSVLAMHVGIGLTIGMYLFAFIMVVLNIAAFGPGLGLAPSQKLVRGAVS